MNEGHVTGLDGVEMVLNMDFLFCAWLPELLGYELQAGESLSEKLQLVTVLSLGRARKLGKQ